MLGFRQLLGLLIACSLVLGEGGASALVCGAPPRVLPSGTRPNDVRLGPLKTFEGEFSFNPPETLAAWETRRDDVRRRVLLAAGLWPMPPRPKVQAQIYGRVERPDFTVERVIFESYPGYWVTGSLFRPKNGKAPCPGVLTPHGHWSDGRFHDAGLSAAREQIAQGAERFEKNGRVPLQSLSVKLARMGCVVFFYDMVSYADAQQIPELEHCTEQDRPGMNRPDSWGFYSPQAELRMQSVLGLQTFNSLRALDFLASLPDVDPARLAVTGGSGGGTQSFLLSAVDDRLAATFPAVMVSDRMQGGCGCENACYLRIGTGNVEFAALTAPRALGMTGANDWTRDLQKRGLPELRRLFSLYNATDRVSAKSLNHFGHNYNFVSREVMYHFMNRELRLNLPEPILEEEYEPLSREELSVWDQQHPAPPSGPDFERRLLRELDAASRKQLDALTPHDAATLAAYRDVVGRAWTTIVHRAVPSADSLSFVSRGGSALEQTVLLRNEHGEELPVILLRPPQWNRQVIVWIGGRGKEELFDPDGRATAGVRLALRAGFGILTADVLFQGEFCDTASPPPLQRNADPLQAGFTYGYNDPLAVQRAHDVLTMIAGAERFDAQQPTEKVLLLAHAGAAPYAALALSQAGTKVSRAAIDTEGFRFGHLASLWDVNFVPGSVKYGDLPGVLSLAAPTELYLAGESTAPEIVHATYSSAAARDHLHLAPASEHTPLLAMLQWLVNP